MYTYCFFVWTKRSRMCLVVLNLAFSTCMFMLQEAAGAGVEFCIYGSIHSVCCGLHSYFTVLDCHRYLAIRTFCVGKLIMNLKISIAAWPPKFILCTSKRQTTDRTSHHSDTVCWLQDVFLVRTSSLLLLPVKLFEFHMYAVPRCVCVCTHIILN
jgi:hypothetical protein